MGNPWMDFLAEERDKDENKDVAPMELSSHVRPKYDAWKAEHGIVSAEVAAVKRKTFKKKMNKMKKTMKKMYAKGKGKGKGKRKGKANAYMMPMQGGHEHQQQEGHEHQQQEGHEHQQQEGHEHQQQEGHEHQQQEGQDSQQQQRGGRSKKGNKKK
jgi:hypothetical protein